MKYIPVLLGLVLATSAAANCNLVENKDMKYLCLAREQANMSLCYNIQRRDIEYLCLAVVHKQKTYCYNIQTRDMKYMCLSYLRN